MIIASEELFEMVKDIYIILEQLRPSKEIDYAGEVALDRLQERIKQIKEG